MTGVNEFLQNNIGKDVTHELHNLTFGSHLDHIFNNYKIGHYAPHVVEEKVDYKLENSSNSNAFAVTLHFLLFIFYLFSSDKSSEEKSYNTF